MNIHPPNTILPTEPRSSADPYCRTVECGRGNLLIEGAVFRVGNQAGLRALDALAALLDREDPSTLAMP